MPNSKNLSDYNNERLILDTALAHSGLRLTFPTPGKAMNVRARLNKFKQLFRANQERAFAHLPGHIVTTPYDNTVVRYDVKPRDAEGKCSSKVIDIVMRDEALSEIFITDPSGNRVPLEMGTPTSSAGESMFDADIADLARDLDLD